MPKDQHTIDRIALLHPKFRDSVTHFIDDAEAAFGETFRVVQGFRTFAEQQAIYNQGRVPILNPKRIVTYSPPGTSYHNYGIAIDVAPIIFDANNNPVDLDWNYDFSKMSDIAAKYNMTWGGNFPKKDMDHFENKFGYNWRDLLHKYNIKDFIAGTVFVNI